ncbi:hypothetical protein A3K34_02120 [candidate division WWE3 bacterium RIFOXYC1_FULL_40_10]|uniref:Uncharacterized protein n=1 Tax=candidate division WWE3 bacterium RIFOXYA2_FULL_46_9 TaxID=1802636 RepID=A0A1F4W1I3_UNCKA|nr:MAG: hypothetical protein A3K58_02120 [candidate division WWE3 bacterium RIFOXYB1_FULL_40_22]OGC61651.1 MAG: hypothetical protein A3K37_02120 [candidate division WWE3 bacterium RIFOXYA1_FULL_40_11]OGC63277.1 MAG: hypothetical protein A2264_02740 [candidate division WWE3 bacterium RIFOXYA2_FULL_46_9]OGC64408.1 MAG: hypothetical protein A2326_02575 [candidate division WWE3 bacterium RIFOXYB2_FULL_41_6]OGC66034.1 MAG: hypothetical protein A3K34_02120 [candidate division WWE3 bacterium RIFOXYC1_
MSTNARVSHLDLVACRSHFDSAYLAWAQKAENGNYEGFGHISGFCTRYDGGNYYSHLENKIWHFFATLDSETELTSWLVLIGDCVYSFIVDLYDHETEDRGELTFEQLRDVLFESLFKAMYEEKQPGNAQLGLLTKKQLKAARQIEKNYFACWGQGRGQLF